MKVFQVRVTSIYGEDFGIRDVLELHWLKGFHLVDGKRPIQLNIIVVDFIDNIEIYDKGCVFSNNFDGTFVSSNNKLIATFI